MRLRLCIQIILLLDRPYVTEWIPDLALTISILKILRRHHQFGPCRQG
jgi:hypothetical protein